MLRPQYILITVFFCLPPPVPFLFPLILPPLCFSSSFNFCPICPFFFYASSSSQLFCYPMPLCMSKHFFFLSFYYFLNFFFFLSLFLAASGLSCSMQDLFLVARGLFVTACGLLSSCGMQVFSL